MRKPKEQRETEAMLLWDYVSVNDGPYRCAVRAALHMTDADIRGHRRYLRDDPELGAGRDVILPTGMSREAHVDPATGDACRCGRLLLNYGDGVASDWYHRRLVTLLGHGKDVERTGEQLQAQFAESVVMARLLADARRVREDVEMALAWMGEAER